MSGRYSIRRDRQQQVGTVRDASEAQLEEAVAAAHAFAPQWDATPAAERADCLLKAAELCQEHLPELHRAVQP